MTAEKHAKVEEKHREKAQAVREAMLPKVESQVGREIVAQALADEYERGQNDTWEAADAAIRAMQPGPARAETRFDREAENTKVILDATRALHEARYPR